MKFISRLLSIILFSFVSNSYSETEDINVRTACKKHSIEVIKNLKQKIFTGMSEEEIITALNISRQSCQKYFGNNETSASKTTEADQQEEKTIDNDWFSEYVLHGDPHSKKGVERLKKRRR